MVDAKSLSGRNFWPLFTVQAFGAFTDNLLKTALTYLVAYSGMGFLGVPPDLTLLLAAGALVLPFILFSGIAGAITDRFDKQKVIRWTRDLEVLLGLFSFAGFYFQSGEILVVAVFGYGTQSAFFGPAKYASLPRLVAPNLLVDANAYFEASTFVAILLGVILGGFLGTTSLSIYAGGMLVALAVTGAVLSRFVPSLPPKPQEIPPPLGLWTSSINAVTAVTSYPRLFRAVVGISYFWAVGLIVITTFPEVAQTRLGISQQTATVLIAAFVVGIGLGSFLIARMLKGEVSAKYAPLGALLMAASLFALGCAISNYSLASGGAQGLDTSTFLASSDGLIILASMAVVAFAGGIFTVPLYALIQAEAEEESSAQTIAGGNIITGFVLVGTVVITSLLSLAGFDIVDLMYLFGVTSIIAALYAILLMPSEILLAVGSFLLRLLFRVEVRGLAHAGKGDEPMIIVANHVSFLDAILLGCFLPGRSTFAIHHLWAGVWWVRPAHYFFDLVEIDPASPFSVRTMINLAKEGRRIVIFPEGRITTSGGLMRIFPGPSMIAAHSGVPILPVRIDGAERSKYSRLHGKMKLKWFPKITLSVLPPRKLDIPADLFGRKARQWGEYILEKTMQNMMFSTDLQADNLFDAMIDARKTYGKQIVFEDPENKISYKKFIIGSFALGERLQRFAGKGERIGLMLPNAVGSAVSIYACLAFGRKVAMVNFTSGPQNVREAIRLSGIQVVLTSRRFVELAALDGLIAAMEPLVEVVYLDDIRREIGAVRKFKAWFKALSPRESFARSAGVVKASDEAVVLFTSGSEGVPKGVSLSHQNFLANISQVKAILDLSPSDRFLSVLPVFHAFGLLAGVILPSSLGIRTFLYASPLHYRIIPALIYNWNATVMFATDTFLAGYAKLAHPYDLHSLRYVAAGAEKLKAATRELYSHKFGIRVHEGYGVTEAAPAISVNTSINSVVGSVGRVLPGIETRLDEVPGITEGGRLHVRGPNIMRGYIDPEDPGKLLPLDEGWYDTGDIVTIDDYDFITIEGRAKRFAKVGGEMVSLAAIENQAAKFWPDFDHVACAVPHEKKGEQLVLVSTKPDAKLAEFKSLAQEEGMAEIALPKSIMVLEGLPLLGSGKVDFAAATRLAVEKYKS